MTVEMKDGVASTDSVVAAIRFGASVIEDQIHRTGDKNAVAYLRARATYFESVAADLNARINGSVSYADLSFLHNLIQSYHQARTITTQWDAPESEHHYNAAVAALRDDLYEMVGAGREHQ